ncbi:sensor histidine kinase [Dactylosporangium aurantiacum]|uniref:histidine kinase n=1 Tax=Dactylosporangium aurantiacum TaxID=35754 RepID=A0A9Q9MGJ4_9ACTN|nr:sensor histidine kinase [Dactylosporangium aurantiacum]MDG6110270.1 sensor histidine kinase [Dactylosporangium aurantiacum]UWZ58358.1 sensor histidine kinase [Dactylosporangium aurantiacum]
MTSEPRWATARRGGVYLLVSLFTGVVTVLTLPLLCVPRLARLWAGAHRDRAGRMLATASTAPPPIRRLWAEPAPGRTLRALLWLPVNAVTGLLFGLPALLCVGNIVVAVIATSLWWAFTPAERPRLFVDVAVTGWTTALALGPLQMIILSFVGSVAFAPLARAHARICVAVLARSTNDQLAERVAELTRTRADVLDAHGAELRRIERDLHDGTQARLVAIAMRLAVARQAFDDDPRDDAFVARLLRDAHEGIEAAMTELREVIRTVYPPILADRGLDGALSAVAAGCAVPTRLDIGPIERVPAAMEAVVYFAVAEALTNVTKHSRATTARVRVGRTADRLTVAVTDDGIGGADDRRGTGLAGIRRRVLALDGTVAVDSPAGGPTTITMELPCGW